MLPGGGCLIRPLTSSSALDPSQAVARLPLVSIPQFVLTTPVRVAYQQGHKLSILWPHCLSVAGVLRSHAFFCRLVIVIIIIYYFVYFVTFILCDIMCDFAN